MVKLEFKDIKFAQNQDNIRATFLNLFYFDISNEDLENIGKFMIKDGAIIFKDTSEKKAWNKFDIILAHGFNNLTNKLSKNKTIYVHQNSDIPLIGSNSFGLTDRDTNLIEIKPITSCNLNCIFCSVDEGIDTKKKLDIVVEKDYLMQEFKKLALYKDSDPLYAYINVHGEPMLYSPMVELIKDLKTIPNVITGIITNGTLLNEKIIDELSKAGLDRINISLSAMNEKLANKLAGTKYNLKKLLKIIEYANTKLEVVVAPVYLKGLNDNEIDKIIEFIISIRNDKGFPLLGIQNFLAYKLGRNPVKQAPWEDFNILLDKWEKKYNINLREDHFYNIFKTKKLEKPFKKGDIILAQVISQDRYPNQCIAKYKDRIISIMQYNGKPNSKVKLKIVRDKHNIFVGVPV